MTRKTDKANHYQRSNKLRVFKMPECRKVDKEKEQ